MSDEAIKARLKAAREALGVLELEGMRAILVEREPRFAEIARQRCEHATPDLGVPMRVAAKPAPAADPRQLGLFGGDP